MLRQLNVQSGDYHIELSAEDVLTLTQGEVVSTSITIRDAIKPSEQQRLTLSIESNEHFEKIKKASGLKGWRGGTVHYVDQQVMVIRKEVHHMIYLHDTKIDFLDSFESTHGGKVKEHIYDDATGNKIVLFISESQMQIT